jgi:competence ComEA-like helix-hairpin-helix protein
MHKLASLLTIGISLASVDSLCFAQENKADQPSTILLSRTRATKIRRMLSKQRHPYAQATERLRAPEITVLININTADTLQLQQLPSIGPKRSEAIIKYRNSLPLQKFESVEQLRAVPGITEEAFSMIHAYIIIN